MSLSAPIHTSGRSLALLTTTSLTTAVTGVTTTPITGLDGMNYVAVEFKFVYGSGGTNLTMYVQTSFDEGVTWVDIMCCQVLTTTATKAFAVQTSVALTANTSLTDGSLSANSILNGVLGDRLRLKYTSTGTYAATTIEVRGIAKG